MASSDMELQLKVFGFLPTTYMERNANKMHQRSSRPVQHFKGVYFHAQTTVHTHLTNQDYFDRLKNPNTPIGAPCQNKDGAGSGISRLYL